MKITYIIISLLLFSITSISQVNVAVDKPVRVDSEISSQPAWKAVDGFNYSNSNRWESNSNGYPHWIEVDLTQEYLVNSIKFYTGYFGDNHPVHEYVLEAWSGSTWTEIVHVIGNSSPVHNNSFDPLTCSKIRLQAIKGEGDALMMYEMEVFALVNLPPEIDPAEDPLPVYSDEGSQMVQLSGIADGDRESVQNLTITALSSDENVVANPVVQYTQGDTTATLSWTPVGPEGSTVLTVTVTDDGGSDFGGHDSREIFLELVVKDPDKNYAPTIDEVPDVYAFSSGETYLLNLTGISDGDHNKDQDLFAKAFTESPLIENVEVFYQQGETGGILAFSTNESAGAGTISVKLSDSGGTVNEGCDSTVITFSVIVSEKEQAVHITADLQNKLQVMEGFGGFGLEKVTWSRGPYYSKEYIDDIVNDLGISILRVAISPQGFEPVNDNADPYDTDLELFRDNIYKNADWKIIDFVRDLAKEAPDIKIIASSWSPPAWMKSNNNVSEGGILLPEFYEEYAECIVAYIKLFKQETGLDLYAISLQNEPTFWEPYESCQYTPRTYCDLIRVVGERFELEGLTTKMFYPEEVMVRQSDMAGWMNTLNNDEYARKYVDIVAVHGYERTGISAGEIGGELWEKYYNDYVNYPGYPKQFWMTETSGQQNTLEGAIRLVSGMSNAIKYGKLNAWVFWSISGEAHDPYDPSHVYNLMLSGEKLKKYYVSKNYYRYVRPGARAVESSSSDVDILVNTFWHEADNTLTYVLINKSAEEKTVNFDSYTMANDTRLYRTSPTENCEEIVIPSGSEVYLLPPKSVSTFVLTGGEYNNHPPSIEGVRDTILIGQSDRLAITLHGITDGDPDKEQMLEITAKSSNASVVDHLSLEAYPDSDSALLVLYLKAGSTGESITTITVTEKDPLNTNNFLPETKISFSTWLINYVNQPPYFNELDTVTIDLTKGQQVIELTGVSTGNEEVEEMLEVGFWAVHDRYFDFDSIVYQQGNSIIYLWVTPTRKGASVVKVSLTDDGETILGDNYFEDRFFIKVDDVGVSTNRISENVSMLFPNPVDKLLFITSVDHHVRYRIIGPTGKLLADRNITDQALSIDTESYPEGMYYIVFSGREKAEIYTFIVLH